MTSPASPLPVDPEAAEVHPPSPVPVTTHTPAASRSVYREKLRETYQKRAETLTHDELLKAYVQQGLDIREAHDDLTWLAVELCWATDGSLWAARRQVRELVRRLRERAENAETVATQAQELLSSIKIPHDPFLRERAETAEAAAAQAQELLSSIKIPFDPFRSLGESHSSEADVPEAQVPTCKDCGRSLSQAVEPGRTHLYHPAGFCSASKE